MADNQLEQNGQTRKQALTPEARRALRQVYRLLIDAGREALQEQVDQTEAIDQQRKAA